MSELLLLLPAAPEVARVAVSVGAYHVGSGRAVPSVAALLGLVGVILGLRALTRPAGRPGGRGTGAGTATGLGLLSLVVGGLHMAYSAGGFGTGNGLAGAIVAVVLGLAAAVLGGLALMRPRPVGRPR